MFPSRCWIINTFLSVFLSDFIMKVNSKISFDPTALEKVYINLRSLECSVGLLTNALNSQSLPELLQWTLKAITLTDLTTLGGDDTQANVERLCFRAAYPLPGRQVDAELFGKIHTAAVCVYPSRVADAFMSLRALHRVDSIQIAAVATGFPSGQYPLSTRLLEIGYAIEEGATEIDVVVNRSLVLNNKWEQLYDEIAQMRDACGDKAHLKTILGIGECGTMVNVYKASMVAMMAGSDFIKTSTGKEAVNATLPVGLVMIRAIQEFHRLTRKKIGLKPAGGVRTVKDSIAWMLMVRETLGDEWLNPTLFRFGASGLLDDLEKQYYQITAKLQEKKHTV
ncbi:deoxyribose-phosphate aldolase isoform X2 [Toxorhynchites rutilus septentrionalis]|uniref:deoxyribose-phosphate aldolase isoform X2 n=1 Tax=Toxorhynchites rutilus septentrionalis TaxID=329112 RepID=UPI002478D6EF|nr:deoxyribose-phosphate aldolase isoform X2 [Toxorhynchites rutilus septentrionalis]